MNIKITLNRIYKYLLKANVLFIVLAAILLIQGTTFLITSLPFVEDISNVEELSKMKDMGGVEFFIMAIIFAPLFETLIFQFGIIHLSYLLLPKKHKRFYFPVILSAILFGLSHSYNLTYMFLGVYSGLIFGIIYVISFKRNGNSLSVISFNHPIIMICMIHSLSNFIPYSLEFIF